MIRTNIYLETDQLTKLRQVAAVRDEPVASLVREAIDEWLRSRKVNLVDDDTRYARLGALLERRAEIERKLGPWDPDQVERDVEEAIREVREARAARRN